MVELLTQPKEGADNVSYSAGSIVGIVLLCLLIPLLIFIAYMIAKKYQREMPKEEPRPEVDSRFGKQDGDPTV